MHFHFIIIIMIIMTKYKEEFKKYELKFYLNAFNSLYKPEQQQRHHQQELEILSLTQIHNKLTHTLCSQTFCNCSTICLVQQLNALKSHCIFVYIFLIIKQTLLYTHTYIFSYMKSLQRNHVKVFCFNKGKGQRFSIVHYYFQFTKTTKANKYNFKNNNRKEIF